MALLAVWLTGLAGGATAGMAAEPGAGGDVAVIVLHGKGGSPGRHTAALVAALRRAGITASEPEMPWSGARGYDRSYDDAMQEIGAAVEAARRGGASTIVVAGHSLGANAALHYGATHDGIAGIVALAPAHTPEQPAFQSSVGDSVRQARDLVRAGRGDAVAIFADVNQGRRSQVKASPATYLSYFDPDGPAVIPKNAAALRPGTALLWIVGTADPQARRGEAYAFALAPANPRNRYVTVGAGHFDTPDAAAPQVVEWVAALRGTPSPR